jgi:hypothetical protein
MRAALLFNQITWHQFSQAKLQQLKAAIRGMPESEIHSGEGEAIVKLLLLNISAVVPNIHWDQAESTSREAEIDLSEAPGTFAFMGRRPALRKGIEFRVTVPFEGNSELFAVQPESYTLSPPTAAGDHSHLVFIYSGLHADVEAWTRSFEESKRKIDTYIASLKGSAEKLNQELESTAHAALYERRSRLERAGADLDAFRNRIGGNIQK